MSSNSKVLRYWAVVAAGFEQVALEEMTDELPGLRIDRLEKGRSQVKIFFTYERSPRRLLELRSIQAVYALIAEAKGITVGKPGLLHLVGQIAKADFGAAQRLATVLDPQREVDVCHVNATIKGRHRFGVSELIFRVQEVLKVEFGMTFGVPEGGLLLQLQVRGRNAVMGMRLRTAQPSQHHAAAFCMGRILCLEPEDRILWLRKDRAEVSEFIQAFGVEVFAGIRCGRALPGAKSGHWFLWDGERVPVLEEECSHFLAQCEAGKEFALIRELARILPIGCIGLIEAEQREVIASLVGAHEALEIAAVLPLGYRGRQHHLYAIERVFTEDLLQVHISS
ncbi:MAG: hypothetical protein VXW00_11745 [Candidatus Latescibacterota bacterium]|nr:hypothetical protein [Candidatus Latescibacterota bacterium]